MQETLTFQLSWKSFVACGDALAGDVSPNYASAVETTEEVVD
jgi:hypothetical protein